MKRSKSAGGIRKPSYVRTGAAARTNNLIAQREKWWACVLESCQVANRIICQIMQGVTQVCVPAYEYMLLITCLLDAEHWCLALRDAEPKDIGGGVYDTSGRVNTTLDVVKDTEAFLLVDPSGEVAGGEPPSSVAAAILIAASPNPDHVKQFDKNPSKKRMYMTNCALDELLAVRGYMNPELLKKMSYRATCL
jgi:hypothetical protein